MNPFASWWYDFVKYTGQSSLFMEGFWFNEWDEVEDPSMADDPSDETLS